MTLFSFLPKKVPESNLLELIYCHVNLLQLHLTYMIHNGSEFSFPRFA